VGHMPFFYIKN